MSEVTTLREWRKQKPGEIRSEHTKEVVVREEKLPVGFEERLAEIEQKCLAFASFGSAFDALGRRVKALEARPVAAANDPDVIPVAIGKIHEKVEGFSSRLDDVVAALAAISAAGDSINVTEGDDHQSIDFTINEDGGDDVLDDIADLCAQSMRTVLMVESMQVEVSSLRRRVNKIDTDVVDLVEELDGFAQLRAG